MGIESFLTASALDCVVAQRLARTALHALQAAHGDPAGGARPRPASGSAPTSRPTSRSAARAAAARGYKGRIGLFSVMVMSERLKEMTIDGASEAEITAVARQEGMLTLREDGLAKVRAGVTSIAEVAESSSLSRARAQALTARLTIIRRMSIDFAAVLSRMVEDRASDVHLSPGFPPAMRVRGQITPLEDYRAADASRTPARSSTRSSTTLSASASRTSASSTSPTRSRRRPLPRQRLLPARRDQRRLPPDPERDPEPRDARPAAPCSRSSRRKPRGFVLVTGPTGSGKSTTLASMVDLINSEREEHILTIEDPIEFLHRHKNCIVNQREIGADATDFATRPASGACARTPT